MLAVDDKRVELCSGATWFISSVGSALFWSVIDDVACFFFSCLKRVVRGDSAGGGQLRVLLQSLDWGTQPVYTGQGGVKVAYVNMLMKQSIYARHKVEGSVSSREYSSFVTL